MSKLEKALERAKKARGEPYETIGKKEPSATKESVKSSAPLDKERIVEPVYTETKVIHTDAESLKEHKVLTPEFHPAIVEQYNLLRARLESMLLQMGYNSVLVTSPGPDEGKTLTAVNLAISISRETSRTVLLIDGDMRKPAITNYLGLPESPGLYEHLTQGVPLNELLINPGWPRFTILPAGKPDEYPADILGSPAMQELIWDVKNKYKERFIIFDSPPLMLYSDGLYLARYVDSVLMVARSGKTKESALKEAIELVKDRPFLGTVLNRVPPNQSLAYEYGKYY